jgi:hypothetical protein
VIGRRLNIPVVSKSGDEVDAHFGWFARFAQVDALASSAKTQQSLAWHPSGPALLADLDSPAYFPE